MRVCNVVSNDFRALIGEIVKFVHKHPHARIKHVDVEAAVIKLEIGVFNKKDWSYEKDLDMSAEDIADSFCMDINNFLHFIPNVERHECQDISE